jgi:rSAM/selenodomain-associated transferase 1
MKERALIVFARNPVKGKVKSRLAKTLGNDKALEIYLRLLSLTYKHTKKLDCDKFLFLSEFIDDGLYDSTYSKKLQKGSDLGLRMLNAFEDLFDAGYNKIVLIGVDCSSLTEEILEESFDKLNAHDVVIGPSQDGGYYLIGLKKPYEFLFANMTWGNDKVLQETIKRIAENNMTFYLVKELIDIDEEEDLQLTNSE